MHHIDRAAPWDEVWQAMEDARRSRARCSTSAAATSPGWHIAQANEAAKSRHFLGLVSEQSLYNLASRTVELEVLPACRAYGLGVIPWSPLAGGLLGGRTSTGDTARRKSVQPAVRTHPPAARAVGEVLRRARRGTRCRRARVAARTNRE